MSIVGQTLKQRAKAMQPKPQFRLLMSPLTRTIYAGRVKQDGPKTAVSTGVRHDVTNDFLGVVIKYGESHGGAFEIVGGGETYDVVVTKRAPHEVKQGEHDLYETCDPDAPKEIKDSNGEVVLDLCKRCGKAEVELLDTQCSGSKK